MTSAGDGRPVSGFYKDMRKPEILLTAVNTKYIHSNLALNSLRQYASEYTDCIEIAEFTINQHRDEIVQEIYRKKPDLLAFSCYIWNITLIEECARILKLLLPDCLIWLGGPEVSFESEQFLKQNPFIDGIMQGEGEGTFRNLLKQWIGKTQEEGALKTDADLSGIPGIVWRGAKGEIHSGRALQPRDLVPMDDLPFVYADLAAFKNKIIYYESSRGCPFSCSYCLSSAEEGVRFRSLSRVLPELRFFLDAGVPQVKFVDRTFNCSHERTMKIWQYLAEHDNGITNFHFEIEANVLTEDEIELISTMRPGLIQMEIGVQTANPQTLRAVHRNPDITKIISRAGKIIAAQNIHVHLDLIAALPYEGYNSFRCSFNTVYTAQPDELQLGFLKMLKGTRIRREAAQYGIIYEPQAPYEVLSTHVLSYDELLRIRDVEEMLEVYYNSRQFITTVKALEKCFPDAFSMYDALARWYRQNGWMGISHSRLQRYELLRRFIAETLSAREKSAEQGAEEQLRWDECLLKDLCLRENIKSRPDWAAPVQRDKVRAFYSQHREYQGHTHLEYFKYLRDNPVWMLFDYAKRNPLTGNAAVREIHDL